MIVIGLPGFIHHALAAAAALPGETTYDAMRYPVTYDGLRLATRPDAMTDPLAEDTTDYPTTYDTARTPMIRGK